MPHNIDLYKFLVPTLELHVQDKTNALDSQVTELKADKIRLLEENKALHCRKSILEKVLALKEEQIQVLQSANSGVRFLCSRNSFCLVRTGSCTRRRLTCNPRPTRLAFGWPT
jgi:hypothetical protein